MTTFIVKFLPMEAFEIEIEAKDEDEAFDKACDAFHLDVEPTLEVKRKD